MDGAGAVSGRMTSYDRELGFVRLCRHCGETWPLDAEFWYLTPDGKVSGSKCRACWSESRRIAGRALVALEPVS